MANTETNTQKVIGAFMFRSKTRSGNYPCKTYSWVCADGVISWHTLILSPEKEGFEDCEIITQRFGKTLYGRTHGIKYSTLLTILKGANEALIAAKIKPKDIL